MGRGWGSRSAKLIARHAGSPTSAPHALVAIGDWRGPRFRSTVPRLAQVAAASTHSSGSAGIAPPSEPLNTTAAPAIPTAAAASLAGTMRSTPSACANSGAESGTVANMAAVSPEGTAFSPQ